MSISRNNHFVPQMYLQNWAHNERRIYNYHLLVPHPHYPVWSNESIEHTASIQNLYVRENNSVEIDDFESDFNERFETPAKRPLEKITSGLSLSKAEWETVNNYILAQYVRTPDFYFRVTNLFMNIMPGTIGDVSKQLSTPSLIKQRNVKRDAGIIEDNLIPFSLILRPDSADEDTIMAKFETVVGKSTWLYAIKHSLADDSTLRNEFAKFEWSVVTSHPNIKWPTSDIPLVLFDPLGKNANFVGLKSYGLLVLFPISPSKVLIRRERDIVPLQYNADYDLSRTIKWLIVRSAYLYIYSQTQDEEIPKMRPRLVDESEFKRIRNEFSEWHSKYREQEVPYLRQGIKI